MLVITLGTIADAVTTHYALGIATERYGADGLLFEANPIVRSIIGSYGFLGIYVFKGIYLAFAFLLAWRFPVIRLVNMLAGFVYMAVGVHNAGFSV